MPIELPALPYSLDALMPYISKETLEYHYGKHHKAYVDKLNHLLPGSGLEDLSLEKIIKAAKGPLFNNAAQVWNHTFYWHCLSPDGGGQPTGPLLSEIDQTFGSFDAFKEQFSQVAAGHFASGWAWLVKTAEGALEIYSTPNAETPLTQNKTPLLTCDVWEHAYYIDTRNDRAKYIQNFWSLVNWEFVTQNFSR